MSYSKLTATSEKDLHAFLSDFEKVELTSEIQAQTISIRRATRLKLPDSIIAATALTLKLPFMSADKQLKTVPALDLLLYES